MYDPAPTIAAPATDTASELALDLLERALSIVSSPNSTEDIVDALDVGLTVRLPGGPQAQ